MLRGVVCADTVGDGVFEIARRGAGVEVALQMACRGAGVEVAPQIARRLYERNRVRFGPVVELVGWHVISGYESVGLDASGTNIVNLKVGGRVNFSDGSVYVGYGHALTDKVWYDDIVRFEYRYSF